MGSNKLQGTVALAAGGGQGIGIAKALADYMTGRTLMLTGGA